MKRVLVVDDEASITDGLVALFQLDGVEASGAYDLEGALAQMEGEFFPLILADVRLRSESEGFALLEAIRRVSPNSRVASLTAYATAEVETRLRELGSSIVLRKPMEFDSIVAIVAEILAEIEHTAQAGGGLDTAALEQIHADLNRMLLSIPQRKYGLSPEEAEDLVQEAWVVFLQKQRDVESVKPWLAGTMVNLSRQRIDRAVRTRSHESQLDESVTELTVAAEHGDLSQTLAVRQALQSLDDRGRALCTLIGIEGKSYDEVADELGLPIGSVGPLYIRAKKKLRAMLEPVN